MARSWLAVVLLLLLAGLLLEHSSAHARYSSSRQLRQAEENEEDQDEEQATDSDGEESANPDENQEEQEGGDEGGVDNTDQEWKGDILIKDLLEIEADAISGEDNEEGLVGAPKRIGSSCTTPNGQSGTCGYLYDSACRSVLNQLQQQLGGPLKVLAYIAAAVKPPCGFEGFDFTICCASSSPQPNPGQPCGVSTVKSQKIIGGTPANYGAWPWAVILGQPGAFGGKFQVMCGGTLISSNTVLTASHCFGFAGQPTFAHVGDTDIATNADGIGQNIPIGKIIQHPAWNPSTLANDITIVKLSQAVQYSNTVRWACLPTSYVNLVLSDTLRNPNPTVIGWGATIRGGGASDKLMQVQVPMVTQDLCKTNYQAVSNIGDNQLCAGSGQADTCQGDSGGAFLANNIGGSWAVVGVTSFGVDCAKEGFPGVYTRVDKYLSWINSLL